MPYEILNKRFRSAQKIIDRELHGLGGQLVEMEKHFGSSDATNESAVKVLHGVMEKLQTMKRKVCYYYLFT